MITFRAKGALGKDQVSVAIACLPASAGFFGGDS